MAASELHDTDFLAWTEQQAAALRQMSGASNSLDIAHLAEEIEGLGKRDVQEVESLLQQMFLHALKVMLDPAPDANRHWRGEILTFQDDASRAFTPSMRQKINVDELWRKAVRSLLAGSLPESARDLDRLRGMAEAPLGVDEFVLRPGRDVERNLRPCAGTLTAVPANVAGAAQTQR